MDLLVPIVAVLAIMIVLAIGVAYFVRSSILWFWRVDEVEANSRPPGKAAPDEQPAQSMQEIRRRHSLSGLE